MRVGRVLLLYLFGFIPLFGLLCFVEGGVRGSWGLSRHDLAYQLSGYITFWGGWLVISSLAVAPLLTLALAVAERRVAARWIGVLGAMIGPCTVLVGAIAVQVASAILLGEPLIPGLLAVYPFALVVGGGALGWAAATRIGLRKGSTPAAA